MNILIVDDRRENLLALEAVLNSPDYHLIAASSGEEALKWLLKDDFAVILLDVQMPGMDGFETASLIRARRRNQDTPIIFITAIYQSTENIVQGYSLGAIDYLFKPFHPQTLKLKIEAIMKMYQREKQIRLQNELLTQLEKERKDRYNILEKLVQERTCELFLANEKLKEEILERKDISLQLAKTSLKLTNILESITDAFFTLNHQWQFVFVNEEAESFWQKRREELIGRDIWGLFPEGLPEYHPLFIKAMEKKEASHFEIMGIHSDVPYEVHVYPSDEGLSVYYHDISQRRLFEKEMARLDRLNLVGQMAAGIGHEIRNPLTTVRGFLQLLGAKEQFLQFKDYFELMIEELDRANSIITEFLSLAKNKIVDLKPLTLNSVLGKLFPLIQADAMLSSKDLIMDLQDTQVLLLDEKEIRQLILNLARNGLEAMAGGGKLTLRTFMEGEETVLTVEDEGSGIKTEDMEKIGTPFSRPKKTALVWGWPLVIVLQKGTTLQSKSKRARRARPFS